MCPITELADRLLFECNAVQVSTSGKHNFYKQQFIVASERISAAVQIQAERVRGLQL